QWEDPALVSRRLVPCPPLVPANAPPRIGRRPPWASRAASCIPASSRSAPTTSASPASTATRAAPSSSWPTSTAASSSPPRPWPHTRPHLAAAAPRARHAFPTPRPRAGLVAIERPGRYHRLVQRAFTAAGFETRIVHPFVTKQYRQGVDPGNKTDDADLAALHRATVTGCALLEATRDEAWPPPLLPVRHRRGLVRKGAALNCQIRDHLEAALPGFAACFDKLWESPLPWHLLRHFPTAEQLRAAGVTALCHSL